MQQEYYKVSAIVETSDVGEGTKIWYFTHVMPTAKIGKNCSIGEHCFIGEGVIIGDNVKIANNVNIYEGTIIRSEVFIGNNVSFTNVRKPLAYKKGRKLDTIVGDKASVGANSTIVAGVRIGKRAIIGEGAVVISNIPEDVFAVGNPAKVVKKGEELYG